MMVHCRECGTKIHQTAITCPKCGANQSISGHKDTSNNDVWWPSIISFVLGIVLFLMLSDESLVWDIQLIIGFYCFAITGLVFGTMSAIKQKLGRGLAIAGVTFNAISILIIMGEQL